MNLRLRPRRSAPTPASARRYVRLESPHTHPAYERVTVLKGTLHCAHGDEFDETKTRALEAGGVAIMPPGVPIFGYTEEETIIQLHGTGPWGIEYVNPEDDPRG